MIDYDKTLQNIDSHIAKLSGGNSSALTPEGFESSLKSALAEAAKMSSVDQLRQLKALREVVDVAKIVSAAGSWNDTSAFVFPMLTGPMSVESMTAWSEMTRRTVALAEQPSATSFSENSPVIKDSKEKDPWGTGDFNRVKDSI